jgi:hypothetical protein
LFNKQLLVFSAEYQPLLDILGGVVLWLICCFLFDVLWLAPGLPFS